MTDPSVSPPSTSGSPPDSGPREGLRARVTEESILPEQVLREVGAPEDGASLLFLGVVRNHNDGRPVSGLHYEAYREMAEGVLAEIAREGMEILGTDRLRVVHRIGDLEVGEISVAIAVSSPHRAEAYEASRYVMEEIKNRLPIWKREHYADGGTEWVRGTMPGSGDEGGEGRT